MIMLEETLILKLQDEVKLQCESAMLAYVNLNQSLLSELPKQAEQNWHDAIENRNRIAQDSNHSWSALEQALNTLRQTMKIFEDTMHWQRVSVFLFIQAILVATANISKLFWPGTLHKEKGQTNQEYQELKKEVQGRSAILRQRLSIDNDGSKSILGNRAMRDHFEHFDEHVVKRAKASNILIDQSITSPDRISNINEEGYLRIFDPNSFTVFFYKDKIDLRALMDAVENLREKVDEVQKRQMLTYSKSSRLRNKDL